MIGQPYFAVSIGVERDGDVVGGVVHDPIHRESYWAADDQAWRGDDPLPKASDEPGRLGLFTGQPVQGLAPHPDDLGGYMNLLKSFGVVRSMGAIALQLADVATGKGHATIELTAPAPWDIAAGFALARGTGCTIERLTGDVPGYGTWGSHSFIISRDPAVVERVAPELRRILERGEIPKGFLTAQEALKSS